MRFIYLDAGLLYELGHHANYARSIVRQLRVSNIDTRVVANALIVPELQAELGAVPHFRTHPNRPRDSDPIVGWLNNFEAFSELTFDDLRRIEDLRADDLVYMGSMYADIFMGLIKWAASLEPGKMPTIVADFCVGPGLDPRFGTNNEVRYELGDLRVDPSAVLYRYAARKITAAVANRLHLATFDALTSSVYQALLGHAVRTLPAPIQATTARRPRAGTRPITVSVLGHQRPDKGYGLIPEVVASLLRTRSDVRILAHNGAPNFVPEPQEYLRAMARQDSRITLDETIAGPEPWARLLDQSDLILCPYSPIAFATRFSSLASEAIANAIPLVVPARTSLAILVADFTHPGTIFESWTAASVLEATNRALDGFDRYAATALRASERWAQTQGPQQFLRSLLALVQSPRAPAAVATA
jgi:hypothetical protein